MDEFVEDIVNDALDDANGGGGLLLGILIGFVAGLVVGVLAQTDAGSQARSMARERAGAVDLSGVRERGASAAAAAVNRSPLPVNIGDEADNGEDVAVAEGAAEAASGENE